MIDKINIDLFADEKDRAAYDQVLAEFISQKVEKGETRNDAQAEWNKTFPSGVVDWMAKGNRRTLNCIGEQCLIDKINELIGVINGMTPEEELKEVLKESLK